MEQNTGRLHLLVARRSFRLQPGNAGKYVVLVNMYVAREMWGSVAGTHARGGVDPAWSARRHLSGRQRWLRRYMYGCL